MSTPLKPMVLVFTKPETLWERFNFYFRGIGPYLVCDKIKYGGGMVECQHDGTDQCTAYRMDQIRYVFWDGGYKKALAEAKNEYVEQLKARFEPPDQTEENNKKTTPPASGMFG
jgi:hypothetical protein